jgi:hypothetical protein
MPKTRPEITQAIQQSRYWRAEDAATVLAAVAASGLTVPAFAVRHGLRPQRLERWQRQLAAVKPVDKTFVEVTLPPVVRPATGAFEIVLHTGWIVRVGAGFDAEELRRLLAVVEEASC